MTEKEREAAIIAHGAAHLAKIIKRRKARASADNRKKARGLAAAIARMKGEG
jgi:hypothetical protein